MNRLTRRAFMAGAGSTVASAVLTASGRAFDKESVDIGSTPARLAPARLTTAETTKIRLLVLGRDESPWRERVDTVGLRLPWVDLRASGLDPSPAGLARSIGAARRGGVFDVIAGIPGTPLARLAREGLVQPLNAWIGNLDLLPTMRGLGHHHQALTGLPLSGYPVYGLVNPQTLEHAGVVEPGDTYADWLETSRRLTDRDKFTYGWGVVADLPEIETVARSAGQPFWTGGGVASSDAWQWYADLIHKEAVSPPPHAWDGLLGAHVALAQGQVAMTIRSAWVLDDLATVPRGDMGSWRLVPLPSWAASGRTVPVRADYVAVSSDSAAGDVAADVAETVATDSWLAAGARGIPSWRPALDGVATALGVDVNELTESASTWQRPFLEVPEAELVESRLLPAIDDIMTTGQPVHERLELLAQELTDVNQGGVG